MRDVWHMRARPRGHSWGPQSPPPTRGARHQTTTQMQNSLSVRSRCKFFIDLSRSGGGGGRGAAQFFGLHHQHQRASEYINKTLITRSGLVQKGLHAHHAAAYCFYWPGVGGWVGVIRGGGWG